MTSTVVRDGSGAAHRWGYMAQITAQAYDDGPVRESFAAAVVERARDGAIELDGDGELVVDDRRWGFSRRTWCCDDHLTCAHDEPKVSEMPALGPPLDNGRPMDATMCALFVSVVRRG